MERSTSLVNPFSIGINDYLPHRCPEVINLQAANQMALHTLPGCQHSTSLVQTGVNGGLDCSTAVGCIVHESTPNSSGAEFNDVGGGVWATQFDVNGILYVSLVLWW